MKINWEVEDELGYVGSSRPQYTIIPDDELDECETEEDRKKLIEEYVNEDFLQKITWCLR